MSRKIPDYLKNTYQSLTLFFTQGELEKYYFDMENRPEKINQLRKELNALNKKFDNLQKNALPDVNQLTDSIFTLQSEIGELNGKIKALNPNPVCEKLAILIDTRVTKQEALENLKSQRDGLVLRRLQEFNRTRIKIKEITAQIIQLESETPCDLPAPQFEA